MFCVFFVFFSGGGARSDSAGATRAAEVRRKAQDAGAADRGVLPAPQEQYQGMYIHNFVLNRNEMR